MTEKTQRFSADYFVQGSHSRSNWGPGEWDKEPDKVQWVDPKTKLNCLIVRTPMGHLCGYVGIPPSHRLYGKDYDAAYNRERYDIHVHGGLTFAAHEVDDERKAKGSQLFFEDVENSSKLWLFGFDCAHCDDHTPLYASFGMSMPGGVYRTVAYVKSEVTSLAEQLAMSSPIDLLKKAHETL